MSSFRGFGEVIQDPISLLEASCLLYYAGLRAIAIAERGRGRGDLGRRWIELARGLEENGAGPSGGGGEERDIFNHRQARWAFI